MKRTRKSKKPRITLDDVVQELRLLREATQGALNHLDVNLAATNAAEAHHESLPILCGVDLEFEHGVSWQAGRAGFLRPGESSSFLVTNRNNVAIFGIRARVWGGAVITRITLGSAALALGRCTFVNAPLAIWTPELNLEITLMVPDSRDGARGFDIGT